MRSKRVKWIGAFILVLFVAVVAFGLHKLRTPPENAELMDSAVEPMQAKQAEQLEEIFDGDDAPAKTAGENGPAGSAGENGPAETAAERRAVDSGGESVATAVAEPNELELLDRRAAEAGEGRSYRITQAELNSYIARKIQEKEPSGLTGVTVELTDNEVIFTGKLQSSRVELKENQELIQEFLESAAGEVQYVTIKGKLSTEQGRGTFEITSAAINQLPLPVDLLIKVLGAIGRRQKEPIDIESWFPLPYGLKEVIVRSGYLVVTVA